MFITNVHIGLLILIVRFFIFGVMVNEEEYLAEICKIAGFALMSHMGKFILSIPDTDFSNLQYKFFIYLGLSTLLFFIGLILIVNGYGIVYEKNRKGKKWI